VIHHSALDAERHPWICNANSGTSGLHGGLTAEIPENASISEDDDNLTLPHSNSTPYILKHLSQSTITHNINTSNHIIQHHIQR
jgi:hypothetical protein